MKDDDRVTASGSVRDIFAHRFVLRTEQGPVLADLGSRGARDVRLEVGDEVVIEGERTSSEIKVMALSRGGQSFDLSKGHKGKHGKRHDDEDAKPNVALRAAADAGLTPIGRPSRKHKHFEVLARDQDGNVFDLHVDLSGHVKKRRPVDADTEKTSEEIVDEP